MRWDVGVLSLVRYVGECSLGNTRYAVLGCGRGRSVLSLVLFPVTGAGEALEEPGGHGGFLAIAVLF